MRRKSAFKITLQKRRPKTLLEGIDHDDTSFGRENLGINITPTKTPDHHHPDVPMETENAIVMEHILATTNTNTKISKKAIETEKKATAFLTPACAANSEVKEKPLKPCEPTKEKMIKAKAKKRGVESTKFHSLRRNRMASDKENIYYSSMDDVGIVDNSEEVLPEKRQGLRWFLSSVSMSSFRRKKQRGGMLV